MAKWALVFILVGLALVAGKEGWVAALWAAVQPPVVPPAPVEGVIAAPIGEERRESMVPFDPSAHRPWVRHGDEIRHPVYGPLWRWRDVRIGRLPTASGSTAELTRFPEGSWLVVTEDGALYLFTLPMPSEVAEYLQPVEREEAEV